ncbi:MAG: ABC transporter permease [Bacteroidales bacterium]|jgi:ABC-type antimicrobial peptide transport system permease subunit|nr:ABC transporter permease [Bacteroidales bacterium]
MIRNYLLTALRSFLKYKGYSFINIAGLAIGMACSVLIMVWVAHELSYDRFNEKSDRLYRLVQTQYYSSGPLITTCMPGPIGGDMVADYPEVEDAFMFYFAPGAVVTYEDKCFTENIRLADPGLFRMFDFNFVSGDPATALDDISSIVITEEMAEKYFPGEDPMGKVLRLNDQFNFKVTAVLEEMPANSSFRFDLCIPFLFLEEMGYQLDQYGWNSYYTYIQLAEGVSEEEMENKIIKHIEEKKGEEDESVIDLWLHPLTKVHLYSVRGGGQIEQVYILSAIAVFILLIACINFMNLSTARSARRAREIGLRKVVGAGRGKIIFQFLLDSILLSLISVVLSAIIVKAVLPAFNRMADSNIRFDLTDPVNILILLGIGIFTGLLAGSYPALYLSAFNPIGVLRLSGSGSKSSSLFRKILVVFQFTLSVILIIATIVISRQLNYMQHKDLGMNMENVICLEMPRKVKDNYEVMKNEFLRDPSVTSVTRTSSLPFWNGSNTGGLDWQDRDVEDDLLVGFSFADYDYDKVLGIRMLEGRFFDESYATDTAACVINKSCQEAMNIKDPIGKWIGSSGSEEGRMKIIGVTENFHFLPLTYEISPLMFIISESPMHVMMIKVSGDNIKETMDYLEQTWTRINPGFPFEPDFLDREYQEVYESESRLGEIFKYFSFLAIFISCLGLLGLASFMAEQRTREIGIRKTFGAPVGSIIMMMSKEFAKLVIIANIVALPIAWYFLNDWLNHYSYKTPLSADIFIYAFLASVLIAMVAVSYQAVKAALMNPVDAIKYE